jgi:hypothetical protein
MHAFADPAGYVPIADGIMVIRKTRVHEPWTLDWAPETPGDSLLRLTLLIDADP